MPAPQGVPLSTLPRPQPGHGYRDDWLLQAWLRAHLPEARLQPLTADLDSLGALSGGPLYEAQLADRRNEPRLVQWDAWGGRIDHIELTPLWQQAEPLAARYGLVARGYDGDAGEYARTEQFALAYLFIPSTDFYGCPLAMSDGAARVLHDAGNGELAERALPRLLSREPSEFWTSGQWMTETAGGSDVSGTETTARRDAGGTWRLFGRKWFTSATTSRMALTLARPEGNPDGSKGLALFYLEPRDPEGRLQHIEILRLKDKLGTRKVPTAELLLDGAPATPVAGLENGVAAIAPMLNITRTWNAVTACALMRRGIALAGDYARKRRAFGRRLVEHPLHAGTLAAMHADWAVATCATFGMIAELGRCEQGHPQARPELLRLLTPVVKLGTARQAVRVASETLECFGGAGYVEDTGLPLLLRDAQVLTIWEGTTNVLALDLLRAVSRTGTDPWREAMTEALAEVRTDALAEVVTVCRQAVDTVCRGLERPDPEPAARNLALAMNHVTGLVWLARLAAAGKNPQAVACARIAARDSALRPDPEPPSCNGLFDRE